MHLKTLIVPFEPWHLGTIDPQTEQFGDHSSEMELYGAEVLGGLFIAHAAMDSNNKPSAWSALVGGRLVASSGVILEKPYRGMAWALFDKHFLECSSSNKRDIINAIKEGIERLDYLKRIQATTPVGFKRADLFLRKLGFKAEGTLREYGPNGEDHCMYGLVR